MSKRLNAFTGRSDKSLHTELAKLQGALNAIMASDGHGGSPAEGTIERMDDIERELRDRATERAVSAVLATPDEDVLAGRWPKAAR